MAAFELNRDLVQLDPITRQRIMQNLPDIQKRMRRSKRLRGQQADFAEMAKTPIGGGSYTPSISAGNRPASFAAPQFYVPDLASAGEKIVGAFGEWNTNRQADKADEELEQMRNPEIMGALSQLKRTDQPGYQGPTEQELRGYLGMLGEDPKMLKDLGIGTDQVRVHGTKTDKKGRVWTIMSDNSVHDTGIDESTKYRVVQDPVTGEVFQIPTSSAGAGESTQVMEPGSTEGGPQIDIPGDPTTGAPAMGIEGMDQARQQRIQTMVQTMQASGVPQDVIDNYVAQEASSAQVQPPAPAKPLTISGAGDVEAAKIGAKNEAGVESATTEGLARESTERSEQRVAAQQALPKARDQYNLIKTQIDKVINDPALGELTGDTSYGRISAIPGVGGMINDFLIGTVRPGENSDAIANIHAQLNQFTDEAFLNAYADALKGTGQVATIEGVKTAAAKLRGARWQTKEEYVAALREFLDEFRKNVVRLQDMSTTSASPGVPGQNSGGWKIEKVGE